MDDALKRDLEKNRDAVQTRIAAACARAGRSPSEVNLLWVSKTHPKERILAALEAGAFRFGENKVQEALEKFPLPTGKPYELHLIGHLQKNKVRKALPLVAAIHSVDSLALLEAVNRIAGELGQVPASYGKPGMRPGVFLQVNTSGEDQKTGLAPGDLLPLLRALPPLPQVRLLGLMTMGPADGDPEKTRSCFRALRLLLQEAQGELKDDPRGEGPSPFAEFRFLSMGMSGDFEIAIEEGSHFIRVGTALFGRRPATDPELPIVPAANQALLSSHVPDRALLSSHASDPGPVAPPAPNPDIPPSASSASPPSS